MSSVKLSKYSHSSCVKYGQTRCGNWIIYGKEQFFLLCKKLLNCCRIPDGVSEAVEYHCVDN
jgi:hypothetical protein